MTYFPLFKRNNISYTFYELEGRCGTVITDIVTTFSISLQAHQSKQRTMKKNIAQHINIAVQYTRALQNLRKNTRQGRTLVGLLVHIDIKRDDTSASRRSLLEGNLRKTDEFSDNFHRSNQKTCLSRENFLTCLQAPVKIYMEKNKIKYKDTRKLYESFSMTIFLSVSLILFT